MPDPSYKSETAAMNSKAKELRAKVNAAAKQKNVSVPKSALDNFIDTYKKTKVGPIQRAISKFLSGFNTKADYTSRKSTTAKLTTRAKVNRATSQGGRSRANVVEDKQKKLAAKSAAQGGGSVLSQRKADKIASDDTKIVLKKDKPAKKSMTLPTPPPKRPKKNKKVTPPKSKPKLYATINPLTGKPVDKKVTAAQHLANIDKFKARKKAQTTIDAALKKATKKTKGK
tara:strand:+ start:72 stop:755 length:684 start_codon:yes stop_codon:yes gene_type:complete